MNPGTITWYSDISKYGGSVLDAPAEGTAGWVFYLNKDGKPFHKEYYEYQPGAEQFYIFRTFGYANPNPKPFKSGAEFYAYKASSVKYIPLGAAPATPVPKNYSYPVNHDWVQSNGTMVRYEGRKGSRADYRIPYLQAHPEVITAYPRLAGCLP